jgi:hypothetical protein
MRVEDVIKMLDTPEGVLLVSTLRDPRYAGKRVILSSDDLTGEESDEEIENIVSIRELVCG